MNQPEEKINQVEFINSRLKALIEIKKSNHVLSQDTITKIISKEDKEKMIIDLRAEYHYSSLLEKSYLNNLSYITKILKETEKNHYEINEYCTSLRLQLKEFVDQIDWYEAKIAGFKEERAQLKRTNEAIILLKETEQVQLECEHKKIIDKTNEQLFKLKKLKDESISLEQQKDNEKRDLLGKEAKNTEQYNLLFKQYRDMLNKFNAYEQDDDASELKDLQAQRRIYKENINKEELTIKLNEEKLKGEMLKKEYEELNNKVKKLSTTVLEEVNHRFASLRGAPTYKDYPINSQSTNRYSTVFSTIKQDD